MSRSFSYSLGIFVALLVAGVAGAAWQAPPGSPTTCPSGTQGCDAPLNVSSTGQIKQGGLTVGAGIAGSGTGLYVQNGSLRIADDTTTGKIQIGSFGSYLSRQSSDGSTILQTGQGNLLLNPTGGNNVGINTLNPNGKLDIATNGSNDGIVFRQNSDNSSSIQAYIDGQWANRATYAGGCCNSLALQPDVGSVGIGTVSPTQKLDVAGNVTAHIYYDRDNTGYYLDPNSTSILNSVQGSIFYDRDNTGYYLDPNNISQVNRIDFDHMYDRNNYSYYIDLNNVSIFQDVRSSIFYDRDNTGYYMDLNNWSRTGPINADALHVSGNGYVCTSNGANCPLGAAGGNFGGAFNYASWGCSVGNPYTGGCSCRAGTAQYPMYNDSIAGNVYTLYICMG